MNFSWRWPFFLFLNLVAATGLTVEITQNALTLRKTPTWTAEWNLNTITSFKTPTTGPTLFYSRDLESFFGFRFLTSLNSIRNIKSGYFIYRQNYKYDKTQLFAEGGIGVNQYLQENIIFNTPSLGTSFGFLYQFQPDFSLGMISGLEWTQTKFHSRYARLDKENLYLYGNLTFLMSLMF